MSRPVLKGSWRGSGGASASSEGELEASRGGIPSRPIFGRSTPLRSETKSAPRGIFRQFRIGFDQVCSGFDQEKTALNRNLQLFRAARKAPSSAAATRYVDFPPAKPVWATDIVCRAIICYTKD